MIASAYTLNSLLWSVCGFVAGYSLRMPDVRAQLTSLAHRVTLGGVLILLALVTTISLYVQNRGLESKSRCQAQFNDEFRQVTVARAQYADDDRQSLVTLMKAIASTSATPQQNAEFTKAVQTYAVDPTPENLVKVFQVLAGASKNVDGAKQSRALQTYLKETNEADKKRADRPLPKLSEECGSQ